MNFKVGDRVVYKKNSFSRGYIGTVVKVRENSSFPYEVKFDKLNGLYLEKELEHSVDIFKIWKEG